MLRHLDLFSGIGGFALAARMVGGYETVAFCEIDPWCQAVLRKHWPGVPVHEDVRTLAGADVGPVDVITGGFPCQDISNAGKRAGIDAERSGLWSEYCRLIGELRPEYALVENVAALTFRGLLRVLGDLAEIGYDAEWTMFSACRLGAPHTRERVFIVSYPRRRGHGVECARIIGKENRSPQWDIHQWAPESEPRRVVDGIRHRSHRLRGLGNAIVPQVAAIFLEAIKGAMTNEQLAI